jgi:hypothetical protein
MEHLSFRKEENLPTSLRKEFAQPSKSMADAPEWENLKLKMMHLSNVRNYPQTSTCSKVLTLTHKASHKTGTALFAKTGRAGTYRCIW